LLKLSQMAADCPEIFELDINPLLADDTGVLALDARVAIRKPTRLFAGQTRFAIRPYPSQWEGQLVLRNGWPIAVRPLRPDDEPAVIKFLGQVRAEDLRLRFFHAVKEFSHQFVGRLTQLDYARSMAFVALNKETGEIIGVARLHSDSQYQSAEYAILVQSNLKGNGLGWALMQLLIDYATAEGLKSLYGQVLAENTMMLRMCRELGFNVKTDPSEAGTMLVSLDLETRSFGANKAALVRSAVIENRSRIDQPNAS
jgi:acetyltransferase